MSSLKVLLLTSRSVPPTRQTLLSVGYDLYGAEYKVIPARGKEMISTEVCIVLPKNTYGRIASRSGLAWKHSIEVGAGVIDPDYTGVLKVILFNHSDKDVEFHVGDRIAQLIIERCETPDTEIIVNMDATERGSNGFGSTG